MSIFYPTLYPCQNCKVEIKPTDRFCQYCGVAQTPLSERLHYNIFTQHVDSAGYYKCRYYGNILKLDEALVLGIDSVEKMPAYYDIYIGAYMPGHITVVDADTSVYQIEQWILVHNSVLMTEFYCPIKISVTRLD